MAGLRAGTVRMIENSFAFGDRSRFLNYDRRMSSDSSISNSISSTGSLPSKESSVDLSLDIRIEPMLRKKHQHVLLLTEKIRKFDHFSCFFALSGLALSLLSCELANDQYELMQILLVLVSISTLLLDFCVFKSWSLKYWMNREKKIGILEGCTKTFGKSEDAKFMVFELVVYSLQPLPFVDVKFDVYQLSGVMIIKLNEILTSFMLLRVFVCFKLLRHHSKWTNEHSSAICDLYAAKGSEIYALKALLIEKPVELLVPLLLISILTLSIALRIYERNFETDSIAQDYSYLWNSMWLILLTMTTAGFGDFYPKTHPGRFIAALSAYWGIFIFSILIITLTNFSHLRPAQQRSYNFLKRLQLRNRSKSYACVYIITMLETLILNSKSIISEKKNTNYFMKLKSYFNNFKKYQRLYIQVDKTPGEMLRIINEKLRIELEKLENQINDAKDLKEQLKTMLESQEKSVMLLKESKNCMMEILRSQTRGKVNCKEEQGNKDLEEEGEGVEEEEDEVEGVGEEEGVGEGEEGGNV